jgi:hypothetical protein
MTGDQGLLLGESAEYTSVEFAHPQWFVTWSSPVSQTELISEPVTHPVAELISYFRRAFVRPVSIAPVYRYAYQTAADQFVGSIYVSANLHTPVETVSHLSVIEEQDEEQSSVEIITDLVKWLRITYDDLARMTGLSRSTLFYWKRTGASPRMSNSRQLLRVYSLASLLVRRFGAEGARRWWASDGQAAWAELMGGDLLQAEELVRAQLFGTRQTPSPSGRVLPDEVSLPITTSEGVGLRRAARSPKRGRARQP